MPMDENTQSILLEQYMLALQTNPFAPPPTNLDPELARMAEKLHAYSRTSAELSAKKRVWKDVMTQFELSQKPIRKEKAPMLATKSFPQKKSSSTSSWMWVAVASVILLFGVAVAVVGNQRPTPPQFGGGINLSQTEISTPVAPTAPATTIPLTSPIEGYVPVVTLYVAVFWGDTIRADMLTITYWEASRVPTGAFSRIEDVVGMVVRVDSPRFLPLTDYMVIDGTLAMTGIPYYPQGQMLFTPTPMNPNMLPILATPTPAFTSLPTFTATVAPSATHTFTPTTTPTFTPTTTPTFTPTPTLRP
jgi:hypothetical protein